MRTVWLLKRCRTRCTLEAVAVETWAAIQATLNHFIKLLKSKDLLTPPAVMPEVEAIEIIEPWTLKKNSDR
jgi:hypothetical protein